MDLNFSIIRELNSVMDTTVQRNKLLLIIRVRMLMTLAFFSFDPIQFYLS